MVFFNHATRQMTAKIVYYGPGLCGKTTNLNTIYGKTSQKARGEMVSLNTETDRTLFFDLLPMEVGMVGGFKTKLQLYTVPGQVFYNSTRKLVLKGVDGIVFVVDSQTAMLDACRESYHNLEANLQELGLNLGEIPMVYQWNKRDLRNVVPVEQLEAAFNAKGVPTFQSVASDGTGVFETLRGITKLALSHIKIHVLGESHPAPVPVPPPVPPPAPAVEALTLSDLPSVADLLDLEGTSSVGWAMPSSPLPDDEDDSGIYIEAPLLPEPPELLDGTLELLDVTHELPPESRDHPAHPVRSNEDLLSTAMSGFDQTFAPSIHAPADPLEPGRGVAPVPAGPAPPTPVAGSGTAGERVPPVAAASPHPAPGTSAAPIRRDPLAALAALKLEARRPAARPKPVDHREAINTLMGELTQAGRSAQASVLRLEVPPGLEDLELEVVVQLRRQGQVLVEGTVHRPAPGKGGTARLSVELKRS
jgi:signal recognition particle receptor subunit beta